jgi:hypothetical protein
MTRLLNKTNSATIQIARKLTSPTFSLPLCFLLQIMSHEVVTEKKISEEMNC